ncbi:hypothetical protein JW960_07655 [candidate division KSB1 bacterium]|nr:hypothetical protein [candidate division KSB1 bacterium]
MWLLLAYVAAMVLALWIQNYPIDMLERSMVALSRKMRLSPIVAGATLIAVTSSSPEFGTAFSGVVIEKSFDIGFQVIVWSALFNILVITGASGIVSKKPIHIDKSLLKRDMLYYVIVIGVFGIIASDKQIELFENVILVTVYAFYLYALIRENGSERISGDDCSKLRIILVATSGLIGVIILSAILVEAGVRGLYKLGGILGMTIPLSVVACTFWGPGTSIVDLMMSVKLARRGHGDSAVVNGIASNTFDVAIVLGLNGLIYNALIGPIKIDLGPAKFLFSLLALSIIVVSVLLTARKNLHKLESWLLVLMFVAMLILQIVLAFTVGM